MSQRLGTARYDLARPRKSGAPRRGQSFSEARNDNSTSPGSQFDVDAWSLLIEEQRLQIARAAGVDPSKVRIKIGH